MTAIDITALDAENFIKHLALNRDQISASISEKLDLVLKHPAFEYNADTLAAKGIDPSGCRGYIDGIVVQRLVSVNPYLKTICSYKDGQAQTVGVFVFDHQAPESFELRDRDGNVIVRW